MRWAVAVVSKGAEVSRFANNDELYQVGKKPDGISSGLGVIVDIARQTVVEVKIYALRCNRILLVARTRLGLLPPFSVA